MTYVVVVADRIGDDGMELMRKAAARRFTALWCRETSVALSTSWRHHTVKRDSRAVGR